MHAHYLSDRSQGSDCIAHGDPEVRPASLVGLDTTVCGALVDIGTA